MGLLHHFCILNVVNNIVYLYVNCAVYIIQNQEIQKLINC